MASDPAPSTRVEIGPDRYRAAVFDLDGVVTDTASVHAAAWQQLFDEFLAARPPREGEDQSRFTEDDYLGHVDGMPRVTGVVRFLESRGIDLPLGDASDPPDSATAHGLGARKDRYFRDRLDQDGVAVFRSTVALVRALQDVGVAVGVFSASRNCGPVLDAAELGDLFPVRVDGVVAAELGLPGKPDPAMLIETARRLGAEPRDSVVVEDAEAGVEAGRRGGFALVIGVDRMGRPDRLREHGAHVVVSDLSEVTVPS